MSQPDAERIMHIGERDYIGFDFHAADLPTDVTVSSGSVTVSPSSGLTLDSPTAIVTDAEDGVYVWLTAMTAGEYDVTFTVVFSDSKDLSRVYRVSIPQRSVTSKALVALDVLKVQLGIKPEETQWDDMLDLIVESVSETFSRYVDYPLAKATLTSVYMDGNGKRDLYLPWKVISALTLEEDGTALTEGEDADYILYADIGMVHRVCGIWPHRHRI